MVIFDNSLNPQKIIKGSFMDVDLVIKLIVVLLLFLWLISQRAFYNPLYLVFFSYHAFRGMDMKTKVATAKLVLDFCELNIGKSKSKPRIDIIKPTKTLRLNKLAGQYRMQTMTIEVNEKYARSLFSLTRVILHEYAHHMQFLAFHCEDYERIFKDPKVNYSNHPWENQARRMSSDFWRPCIEYVLIRQGYMEKEN